MSLSSVCFLAFVCVTALLYFALPKNKRFIVLLAASYIYYLAAGPKLVFFLLFSTLITFSGGLLLEKGVKGVVPVCVILSFGVLAVVKYANFAIYNFNNIFGTDFPLRELIFPLGISFYTFQSVSYLLDVRWKKCKAEHDLLRYMLFVSFFPQIMQGPIGRYSRLAPQLYEGHDFDFVRLKRGALRILWGFFKKMVIADNAAVFVSPLFDNYDAFTGYGVLAVLMYCAQLYADFSGGIDIVIGIAEILGVEMDENFRQPFFAVSITDFWHRWHITLGTWMKDYVFYPISLSNWMGKFGKWCRKHMPKSIGRALPICIANIIVFLVVGIWHGSEWHYIFYGLYNGIIIGVSGLMTKPFRSWKKTLNITDDTKWFHAFQIARTFLLVNISWYLDRCTTIPLALRMFKESITDFRFSTTLDTVLAPGADTARFMTILAGCIVVLVISILREKNIDVRGAILARPAAVQAVIFIAVILVSVYFSNHNANVGGFIYANF